MSAHKHPMPGQQLMHIKDMGQYEEENRPGEVRTPTDDLNEATVVTSQYAAAPEMHRPVLDLDLPAKLIPSTTPGHFHLYVDRPMTWDQYVALLEALAVAGVVERGYVDASVKRGYTCVRLPWVAKVPPPEPQPAAPIASDPWADTEAVAF